MPHRFAVASPTLRPLQRRTGVVVQTEASTGALVLAYGKTGLGTVRGLAAGGVDVHAAVFAPNDATRWSRHCQSHLLTDLDQDESRLLDWLEAFGHRHRSRPVLIPTSDAHALLLARHAERLSPLFRLSTTTPDDLLAIVSKGLLYRRAAEAGVDLVPGIAEPDTEALKDWLAGHAGPWLVKPFYEGYGGCALTTKNQVFERAADLLGYARSHGTRGLVIQQMLRGGDGHVYDCYGLTGHDGSPLTMASHRRWRQMPPHRGCTSFGEIPAAPEGLTEDALFARTAGLLGAYRYHGIFGVEWLQDRETGRLYLIDFNARPFSSIGHLNACGLNLPLLAYRELRGDGLKAQSLKPHVRHLYWIDLLDDLRSMRHRPPGDRNWGAWVASLLRCRSFAHWQLTDPLPALRRGLSALGGLLARRHARIASWTSTSP